MTVRIRTITFDCSDPYLLAGFWSKLTGYGEDPTNTNHPDDPEGLLVAPDGSANLLFIHVPEGKQVKNRVHLDLMPAEPTPEARDAEMERAIGLGATLVEDHRRPDRTGWVVLADPEGNEFCIERGVAGG
ncbi:MAG TPA: VOC family protein [Streptosporangiaceae bacterium]|nr:VOC family protein [Streptosporangiaceae bacterium]